MKSPSLHLTSPHHSTPSLYLVWHLLAGATDSGCQGMLCKHIALAALHEHIGTLSTPSQTYSPASSAAGPSAGRHRWAKGLGWVSGWPVHFA
eukprot:1148243-Pelagomonas_calceolata.AAC.2